MIRTEFLCSVERHASPIIVVERRHRVRTVAANDGRCEQSAELGRERVGERRSGAVDQRGGRRRDAQVEARSETEAHEPESFQYGGEFVVAVIVVVVSQFCA